MVIGNYLDDCTCHHEWLRKFRNAQYVFHKLLDEHKFARGLYFIAETEGELVGCVSVDRLRELDLTNETWYVSNVCVVHSHRRKGVGAAMIVEAYAYASEMGALSLCATVPTVSSAVRALFEKLEFINDDCISLSTTHYHKNIGNGPSAE